MADVIKAGRTALVNPRLQQTIAAFKAAPGPQTLNAVINAMLQATLLMPVGFARGTALPKPDAKGHIVMPADTQLQFAMLTNPEKERYFIVFTDRAALAAGPQKTVAPAELMLRFDDLAGLLQRETQAAGFIIDPYTRAVRFTRAMVESIVRQREAQRQARAAMPQPGEELTVVEPSVPPDALFDPVCALLEQEGTIDAAYLQLMIRKDGQRSYLLVLDGPASKPLMQKLTAAAKPFLQQDAKKMPLAITSSATPLGRQGMAGSEPFYKKGEGRVQLDEDE